jgi:hypothetical protein
MMRTTDFCFPLPDTEHPRLVSYRLLFETYASPLTLGLAPVARRPVNLAFHDALIASVSFLGLARGMFPPCVPDRAVPLTPLSPPSFCPCACARGSLPGRQGRFLRPSVKMRRSLRPEVPSIAGGHSRACVNRCRSRGAVTCVSATTRPSPPFRSRLPRPGFRPAAGYRSLDPRPCPPCAPRFLTECRQAILWVRLAPKRLLQLHFRRADTPSSIRFSPSVSPARPCSPTQSRPRVRFRCAC